MRAIVHFSLLCLTVLLGACDRTTELGHDTPPEALRSIASLKGLCTADYVRISQDISVRGIVVGNDLYGEFPKTIVLQDSSGGICVAVDQSSLHRQFPFGCEVTVTCNGLALGNYGGKILLGAEPDGHYAVTRIAATDIGRYLRVSNSGGIAPPEASSFADIGPQHIDTFVRFEDVRFAAEGCWHDTADDTAATEHTILDAAGRTFTVRVPSDCTYAKEPVPSGTGSLYGVIDYFAGKYSLRVSDRSISFATSATHPTACP